MNSGNDTKKLILALPKGRILEEAIPILKLAGIEPEPAFLNPLTEGYVFLLITTILISFVFAVLMLQHFLHMVQPTLQSLGLMFYRNLIIQKYMHLLILGLANADWWLQQRKIQYPCMIKGNCLTFVLLQNIQR